MEIKDIEEIKYKLEGYKKELKEKYGVIKVGIFGSYVRNEQKKTSDLDILVEFEKPISLFDFVGLKNYLSDLLNLNIDLVMKKGLRPRIGERILKEVVYV